MIPKKSDYQEAATAPTPQVPNTAPPSRAAVSSKHRVSKDQAARETAIKALTKMGFDESELRSGLDGEPSIYAA